MCLKALLQLYVSYHHTEFSYQPKLTELSKMMLFLIMQQNTKMTDNSVIKKTPKNDRSAIDFWSFIFI